MNIIRPEAEIFIRELREDLRVQVRKRAEERLLESMISSLENSADDIQNIDALEEKMQGLSMIFVEILENEMDKYINDKFISEAFKLRYKLNSLAAPKKELTRRESAQRKIIVNWLYLVDNARTGETPLSNFINRFDNKAKSLIEGDDSLLEDEQKKEEFDGLNLTREL